MVPILKRLILLALDLVHSLESVHKFKIVGFNRENFPLWFKALHKFSYDCQIL